MRDQGKTTLMDRERGEQIANATAFHEKHSCSWVTRTYLFDSIIREQVAQGART